MGFVDINPHYRALLTRQGLVAPTDFFDLQGVFVGGHADRSVARLMLGEGADGCTAYLKREQHIRWRHRLASAWAGFGFVSRCAREALVLQQLRKADIACPEVIAAGEDGQGRAFLLVRELSHTTELRQFLRAECPSDHTRREVAVLLGRALARLHAAGFIHSDLYSKHVLVRKEGAAAPLTIAFLDWQRSRCRRLMPWSWCRRDLAAVDATLADDLATPRQRLACVKAYCLHRQELQDRGAELSPTEGLARIARQVRGHALRLLRRRRIAEMCQPPIGARGQSLVKADSNNVCLTGTFHEELRGTVPSWLRFNAACTGPRERRVVLPIAGARPAVLVRQRISRPFAWLWAWLHGKRLVSAEVEQASTLFRLERYGIPTPRLLAFGQRCSRPWQMDSLLLTEVCAGAVSLETELDGESNSGRRWRLVREAGEVLRRLHAAACYFPVNAERVAEAFQVRTLSERPEQVLLAGVGILQRRHRQSARHALQDIVTLHARLGLRCSRTDGLRFLLAYLGLRRPNVETRRLVRRILRARPHGRPRRAAQRRAGT